MRENLIISDRSINEEDIFTFYSEAHNTTAWLDHLISSANFNFLVECITVDHSYISSDHFPVYVTINLDKVNVSNTDPKPEREKKRFIKWNELSVEEKEKYTCMSDSTLSDVILNHSLILCNDPLCQDPVHISAINLMYHQIIEALEAAGNIFLKP